MAFDSSKNWHYVKNGEAAGPVPGPELRRLAGDGAIRPATLIWNPTLPNWVEAGSFGDLFPNIPMPPPIPAGGADPVMPAPQPVSISPVSMSPVGFADLGPDLGASRASESAGTWSNASLEPSAADSPYVVEAETRYAGFWIRVVAYVIDAIILAALTWAVVQFTTIDNDLTPLLAAQVPLDQIDLAIAQLEQMGVRNITRDMVQTYIAQYSASSAISFALTVLYFVLIQWILQATLGKLIVGIRLRTRNGENAGFIRVLWRYLMTFISAAIIMIGYLMVAFTREKTALHDLLAGTRVVYRKQG